MRLRVAIDWQELEAALTWRSDEETSYLDLRTGQVVSFSGLGDEPFATDEIDRRLAEGKLVAIDPLPSHVEHGWMEEFAAGVPNARLRRRLREALASRGAFRRFKDALISHPSERAAWFAFRDARVREAAREWAEENGIAIEARIGE